MVTTIEKIYNYFERNENLHVLFIFDPSGMIEDELSTVQWREGYRYLAPKGGEFTIKYKIDREWANDKVVLAFRHASPVAMKMEFPLMDLLKANLEFHVDDYAVFMQQHRIKPEYATFVSRHNSDLQSSKIMTLLERHYDDGTFNTDMACRAFISSYLDKTPKSILNWETIIIRLILLADENAANKRKSFFDKLDKNLDAKNALTAHLEKTFSAGLQLGTAERVNLIVQKMKYNAITQSLPVNPNDNYKHLRIEDAFALQEINHIMEQATTDPKYADTFRKVVRTIAADVREREIVMTYGVDADYWTVTPSIAWAILNQIITQKVETEPQEALDRIANVMIKCTEPEAIKSVVDFTRFTAQYYLATKGIKTTKLNTPDEYVSRYITEFHLLDNYYRNAVSRYYAVESTVPVYQSIETAKGNLDTHYHRLTNRINLDWTTCLEEAGGFSKVSLPRQQDFYDRYVKPMDVKVVVIISDALRYEMAAQLADRLATLKHPSKLEAALAMLPTETCFCKPVLLPHNRSHLVDIDNMQVDGQILNTTPLREKQLKVFKPDSKCMTYDTFIGNKSHEVRELFKHDVVYVYHGTIDDKSHGVPAKTVTDNCESALEELARCVKSLHDSWNVTHVIITSDHGFLFNDIVFEDKDKLPIMDELIGHKSRFYVTHSSSPETNIVKFPLKEVSDMDNEDLFVAVPRGTNRLLKNGGDYVFCHGGASLQETIIPVIVSHRESGKEKRDSVSPMVLEQNLNMVSSRVKFTVLQKEVVGTQYKECNVMCAIYDGDDLVSPQVPLSLNRSDASLDARKYPVELTLNKATSASVLQLRIIDIEDPLNPLVRANVTNNTLIEMDF